MTQWFFGPPLIDRGFRFTGGACEMMRDPAVREGMSEGREIFTGAACKAVGGQWKGGHDISGHVFLLILGSAMLVLETVPFVSALRGWGEETVVAERDGKIHVVMGEVDTDGVAAARNAQDVRIGKAGVMFALGVAALSWWMLLMTATFFHTWFEKFTGLLVAFAGIFLVYLLPRAVPPLRAVLGMPGL